MSIYVLSRQINKKYMAAPFWHHSTLLSWVSPLLIQCFRWKKRKKFSKNVEKKQLLSRFKNKLLKKATILISYINLPVAFKVALFLLLRLYVFNMLLHDFLSKSPRSMAILEKSSTMFSICLKQHFAVIIQTLQGSTKTLQMSFSLWVHILQQVQSAWPTEMRVAAKPGVGLSWKIYRTGKTACRFPDTLFCQWGFFCF